MSNRSNNDYYDSQTSSEDPNKELYEYLEKQKQQAIKDAGGKKAYKAQIAENEAAKNDIFTNNKTFIKDSKSNKYVTGDNNILKTPQQNACKVGEKPAPNDAIYTDGNQQEQKKKAKPKKNVTFSEVVDTRIFEKESAVVAEPGTQITSILPTAKELIQSTQQPQSKSSLTREEIMDLVIDCYVNPSDTTTDKTLTFVNDICSKTMNQKFKDIDDELRAFLLPAYKGMEKLRKELGPNANIQDFKEELQKNDNFFTKLIDKISKVLCMETRKQAKDNIKNFAAQASKRGGISM